MNTEHYFEDIGAWPKGGGRASPIGGAYVIGFALSLALTGAAFLLILRHALSAQLVLGIVVALALIQVAIQVRCFLHMGKGVESRARLIMFSLTSLIVFILVAGSLWIMFDLNNRMMPSEAQMDQYMQTQTGI